MSESSVRVADVASPTGFVLIVVLMWLGLLATMALGLSLAAAYEPLASAALRDRARLRRAAESAATLATLELAMRADWSTLPATGPTSAFTDGTAGARTIGPRAIDLAAETNTRTCGRTGACDDFSTTQVSSVRPWGTENPRWRLFVHLPFSRVDSLADRLCRCYLVAWVADDAGDADGDAAADAPLGVEGHGVLRVRGAAFDGAGGLAEVETVVAQPCRHSGAPCAGIRVQSWGAVRDPVP